MYRPNWKENYGINQDKDTEKKRKMIRLGIGIMNSPLNMVEVPTEHPCLTYNSNRKCGYWGQNKGLSFGGHLAGLMRWEPQGKTRSPSPWGTLCCVAVAFSLLLVWILFSPWMVWLDTVSFSLCLTLGFRTWWFVWIHSIQKSGEVLSQLLLFF